jgi:hypothetical protein
VAQADKFWNDFQAGAEPKVKEISAFEQLVELEDKGDRFQLPEV